MLGVFCWENVRVRMLAYRRKSRDACGVGERPLSRGSGCRVQAGWQRGLVWVPDLPPVRKSQGVGWKNPSWAWPGYAARS